MNNLKKNKEKIKKQNIINCNKGKCSTNSFIF